MSNSVDGKALAAGYDAVAEHMSYGQYRAAVRAYEAAKQPVDIEAGGRALFDSGFVEGYSCDWERDKSEFMRDAKACAKAWGLTTSQPQKAGQDD